jgi:hypothetical protein
MNLANFIDADLKTIVASQYLNPACLEDGLECLTLWRIMHDITNGLAYIHRVPQKRSDPSPITIDSRLQSKFRLLAAPNNRPIAKYRSRNQRVVAKGSEAIVADYGDERMH